MKTTTRARLLCGLTTAILTAAPAFAVAREAPADAEQATEIGDIIVTGRKREEALQDVPLAITAVAAEELDRSNVLSVSDLYGQTPGLFTAPGSVSASSDLNYLSMRGVGFNAGLEPAVGVFIDGMYQPQIGFDTALLDLERIEVLRGPQGTLFGRNTQGGAVNMITRAPGPDARGRIRIDVAEFNTQRVLGSFSGPLADTLFAGISAEYGRSDGFIYNAILDQHQDEYEQKAVRGALRWLPTPDIDVTLTADATDRDYNEVVRGVRLAGDHDESLIDQDRPDSKSNHGVQLNIVDRINDSLTLTSITGYRYSDSDNYLDMESRPTPRNPETLPAYEPLTHAPVTVSGAALAAQVDQTFISQEFRLEGEGENFNWVGGLYYFRQEQNQARQREVGRFVSPILPAAFYIHEDFHDDREGYAAFGQASWRPTDRLEVTVGTRYSVEEVDGTGLKVSVFGAPVNRTAPIVRDGHETFDNLSWMASASWAFTPDVRAYFTYAQGWKAGGVDRYPARTDNLIFRPESSDTYEVGLKSTLLDRRLVLNLAAYHIDIENQQLAAVIPDPRGGPVPIPIIDDASRSHVDGFEAEATFRPFAGLQINAAYSYSDGVFDEFVRSFGPTDNFDMAGTSFENVPKVTAALSALYSRPLPGGRTLELFADWRHVGEIIFQDNTRRSRAADQLTTPAYDRLNLSASVVLNDGLKLTGYVNNVLDSFDYSYISSDPFEGGDAFVVPLPPRQFGVRVSASF